MDIESLLPKHDERDEEFKSYVIELAKEYPEYEKDPLFSYVLHSFKLGSKELNIVDSSVPLEMQNKMIEKFKEINSHLKP